MINTFHETFVVYFIVLIACQHAGRHIVLANPSVRLSVRHNEGTCRQTLSASDRGNDPIGSSSATAVTKFQELSHRGRYILGGGLATFDRKRRLSWRRYEICEVCEVCSSQRHTKYKQKQRERQDRQSRYNNRRTTK